MKRIHVNVAVTNLENSMRFYSSLFGADPAVVKSDYAKWMLDDPRVNFAITARGSRRGIDHLGIQVETREELADIYNRLEDAGVPLLEQGAVTCCYAHSRKHWARDPEGVAWETFLTTGNSAAYGSEDVPASGDTCCDRPAAARGPEPCCAGGIPLAIET